MSRDDVKRPANRGLHDDVWLARLRGAVDNTSTGDSASKDSLCLFFDSIYRLNEGIGTAKIAAELPEDPDTLDIVYGIAGMIDDVLPLVCSLQRKLKRLLDGDVPIFYGGICESCWADIVLSYSKVISLWVEKTVVTSREHLRGIVYHSGEVKVQLEIELKRVLKLVNPSAGGDAAGVKVPQRTARNPKSGHRLNSEDIFKSALRKHHEYQVGGSVMNLVPITLRRIEMMTDNAISDSTAWRLLTKHFGSVQNYKDACIHGTIGIKLVVLLGDALHAFGTIDPKNIEDDAGDDADSDD